MGEVLDRVMTPRGELVLRRTGEHLEVISNGVFLMDTRDGRSERLLVRAALDEHPAPRRLLIGGLGVGFSLDEAVADGRLREIVVVEVEEAVVRWHRDRLLGGATPADPRVQLAVRDLADHLRTGPAPYDAICLDVDNGPEWTVTAGNTALYGDEGIGLLRESLTPNGVLGVWSAHAAPSYEERLRAHFAAVTVLTVDVPRGEPDVVYVARRSLGVNPSAPTATGSATDG